MGSRRAPRTGSGYGEHWTEGKKSGDGRGRMRRELERHMSEGNALFSPPTGPRGFLGYPSVVYVPVYAIVRCTLYMVYIRA